MDQDSEIGRKTVLTWLKKPPRPFKSSEIPYMSRDFFVMEQMLCNFILDIADEELWHQISQSVYNRFNFKLDGERWFIRWINELDRHIENDLGFKVNEELPTLSSQNGEEEILNNARIRLEKFRSFYQKLNAPLCIRAVLCTKTQLVVKSSIFHSSHNPVDLADSQPNGVNASNVMLGKIEFTPDLFSGVEFFLPKSNNLLDEAERWKLETLIRLHGGGVNPFESYIKEDSIVLSTGDAYSNLWRIPHWYKASITSTSLIYDCVKNKTPISTQLLLKHAWESPLPREESYACLNSSDIENE